MGAVSLAAFFDSLAESGQLTEGSVWVPPLPADGGGFALPEGYDNWIDFLAPLFPGEFQQAPPVPPVVPPTVNVVTDNAFGRDPFDANGCPILSPTDLTALSVLPYREFRAVGEAQPDLPPLPEGFDVMPLAQGTGIFVETEDFFRFRAISTSDSVPVSFFGRVQRPSGYIIPFNHTLTTSTANTTFTTTPVPGKGILLGCAASVPIGSITSGVVNAVGEIGRIQGSTFTPHTLLFSGQLDDLYPLTVDGGGIPSTGGRVQFLNTSSAAASATPKTITVTPSAGKRIRFTRILFTITTSAAAGDRSANIVFVVGGTGVWAGLAGLPIAASATVIVFGGMSAGNSLDCTAGVSGGIPVPISLPDSLYFYDAVDVQMAIAGSGAGDTVSAAFLRWEES